MEKTYGNSEQTNYKLLLLTVLLFSCVAIIPFASVFTPPLLDLPNHLARFYIIHSLSTNAALSKIYYLDWHAYPYVLLDVIVPILLNFMPLMLTGKVVILLILAFQILGTFLLNKTIFERWSWWPLSAFLLVFNTVLKAAFLNYLIGIGFMLFAFYVWIHRSHKSNISNIYKLIILSLLSCIIYFSHILAFVFYAVSISIYATWECYQAKFCSRKLLRTSFLLLHLVPPLVIYFLFSRGLSSTVTFILPPHSIINTAILFKIPAMYRNIYGYLTIICVYAMLLIGLVKGWLRIQPGILAVVLTWTIILIISPLDTGWNIRFAQAAGFLLIAGSCLTKKTPSKVKKIALLLLSVMFVTRIVYITNLWHHENIQIKKYIHSLQDVKQGAAVLPVIIDKHKQKLYQEHMSQYAVIYSNAFVPQMFTSKSHMVLRNTKPYQDITMYQNFTPIPLKFMLNPAISPKHRRNIILNWRCRFDNIVLLGPNANINPFGEQVTVLYQSKEFSLFKVNKSACFKN